VKSQKDVREAVNVWLEPWAI